MQRPIQVALLGLTPLIRDVVRNLIAEQSDMHVAAVYDEAWGSKDCIGELADVFVIAVEPGGLGVAREQLLMSGRTTTRVIDISDDGRLMHVSELRPSTTALGALSAQELIDVIRSGNRRTGGSDVTDFKPGV